MQENSRGYRVSSARRAVRRHHVGVGQFLGPRRQYRRPVGVGDGFGFVAGLLAVRRCQMPLGVFELGLGLVADGLAVLGDVVGDLPQPGVRGGQRLLQGINAPACVGMSPRRAAAATPSNQQNQRHDDDHRDADAGRDQQPVRR